MDTPTSTSPSVETPVAQVTPPVNPSVETPVAPVTPPVNPPVSPSVEVPAEAPRWGGSHAAACGCLDQADQALAEARATVEHTRRYSCAHVAALRAAAAVLAVRAQPRAIRGQRNAWVLLSRVAPELGEWAAFFAAGAAKRSAADAGRSRAVTTREADDLIRAADQFIHVVEHVLGLSRQRPLDIGFSPSTLRAG
ncbi:MAG: SAV_6107 family HEPN domain-containing protein [Nocardioidaceae bacterium]